MSRISDLLVDSAVEELVRILVAGVNRGNEDLAKRTLLPYFETYGAVTIKTDQVDSQYNVLVICGTNVAVTAVTKAVAELKLLLENYTYGSLAVCQFTIVKVAAMPKFQVGGNDEDEDEDDRR